ncbi:lytic polysaccharide monooxygenase [Lentithecium fluviatile CBS 122367]|uniref:Lytic polysaccharide monooxygenase n=1 Tax=Lentithecium fluviatile CBS 122367 TaxID=1168545 RepID=A0A6G1JG63_9PLEO|nr:lytic polysaccharide monooxygenase [Lentithecium fluviatile CBS 122367]
MAHFSFTRTLCTLPLLSLALALSHIQMEYPSPLRDPHSNCAAKPKDYNILTPLHADGSDFTCKWYQWNTPRVSVAQYEAVESYEARLKGDATPGGGSCQISLSCDNGVHFKGLKSIVGGCPLQKRYEFTLPEKMYMTCAVVDVVGASGKKNCDTDAADVAAAAQAALSDLPDMFVENLKNINDCTRSNGRAWTGVGRKSAAGPVAASPSSDYSSSDSLSGGSSAGNDGKRPGGDNSQVSVNAGSDSGSPASPACNDGQWHSECVPHPPDASATPAQSGSDAAASADDADYQYVYVDGDGEAADDESKPAPKKHHTADKSAHRHQGRPAQFYEEGDDEADNQYAYNNDEYYAYGDNSDSSFNRQIATRQGSEEEEPTSVPTFDFNAESAPPAIVFEVVIDHDLSDDPPQAPSTTEEEPTRPGDITLSSDPRYMNASLYANTTPEAITTASPSIGITNYINEEADRVGPDSKGFNVDSYVDELAHLNERPSMDEDLPEPEGFSNSDDISIRPLWGGIGQVF